MKKVLGLCALVLVLSFSSVSFAMDSTKDSIISTSRSYEVNLCRLLCGESWEIPSEHSEFTPDEPLGEYLKEEPPKDILDKYSMYLSLSGQLGLIDSDITSEDVDSYRLSKAEELYLSDVEFKYFYNYFDGSLIQWYTVYWVSGAIERGYLVWDSPYNVAEVKMY